MSAVKIFEITRMLKLNPQFVNKIHSQLTKLIKERKVFPVKQKNTSSTYPA